MSTLPPPDTLEEWEDFLWHCNLSNMADVFQQRFGSIGQLRTMLERQTKVYNDAIEIELGIACKDAMVLEKSLKSDASKRGRRIHYKEQVLFTMLGNAGLSSLHKKFSEGKATRLDLVVAMLAAGVDQCNRIADILGLPAEHPLRIDRCCYAGERHNDPGNDYVAWVHFHHYSRSMNMMFTAKRFESLPFERMVCVVVHELVHFVGGCITCTHGHAFQQLSVRYFGSPPCPRTHEGSEPAVEKLLAAFIDDPTKKWTLDELMRVAFLPNDTSKTWSQFWDLKDLYRESVHANSEERSAPPDRSHDSGSDTNPQHDHLWCRETQLEEEDVLDSHHYQQRIKRAKFN